MEKKESWPQEVRQFCMDMTIFLKLVNNRDLSFIMNHLPQDVEYLLMAILLQYFELLIVCWEKVEFGELVE